MVGLLVELTTGVVERHGQASQINAALQWIPGNYAEPFSVARMADDVGMSVSAFHHQFKALTASSPVQYLKSVRLHKSSHAHRQRRGPRRPRGNLRMARR
jgi:transcriptional regulator GlxA family with amidase domain